MVTDKHGATRSDFIAYARSKHASELMFPAEVVVSRQIADARLRQGRSIGDRQIRPRAGGGEGGGGGVVHVIPGRGRSRGPESIAADVRLNADVTTRS